ncbi:hypothetical protein VNI00_014435 [Paramarasmius palmivorus]|uniref:Carboxylic ester hydrolase n=1 Tax=Paramarasmius palmivorus TaxID=297713 RepID=A0AAW0BRG3_9AGAR
MHLGLRFGLGLLTLRAVYAAPFAAPTVQLDSATVTGSSSSGVDSFLGIPFAQPPIGDRRYRLPEPISPYQTSFSATSEGPICPQKASEVPVLQGLPAEIVNLLVNLLGDVLGPDNESEDCLTINVYKPSGITPDSKLPVLVWIFGGGFESGPSALYDGNKIVERSIALGQPVIYVGMNYRLNGFGFLASQEIKGAGVGNLGLQDQREAFRWIQKYIGAFGGDPTKVTIWGESAGAISVALHMLANDGNTEGLFRAAFMQSGAPIPVGGVENGQKYYDQIVSSTGCSGSPDTLQCLREVPYTQLKAAIDETPGIFSYQSLNLPWLPRADGTFLSDNPQKLVQEGKVANIPMISGNCDDEGTAFSLSSLNITTNAQVREYIKTNFITTITDPELDQLLQAYPQTLSEGSPYNTAFLNAITPQFKRIASFQGDAVFQAPRRFFLQQRSGKQPIWTFLSKRLKITPFLGSLHGSDLLNTYGPGDMTDYLVRFTATLNPNGNTGINWPEYTKEQPTMLQFQDGFVPLTLTQDTYRQQPMEVITQISLAHPV